MTKKKRRLKATPIIILIFVVALLILLYCVKDIYSSLKSSTTEEVKILNEIKEYSYTLEETDSAYVTEMFKKLEKELNQEVIDEENYATIISKMFLADFFTLNSAINKNNVGGEQFVYSKYKESFLKNAKDTVYRYVENNIYETRKQELPIVSEVEVTKIEQKLYDSDEITDAKAFYVDATISYKEDMGYQTEANLIIVHSNNKLEIAVMK